MLNKLKNIKYMILLSLCLIINSSNSFAIETIASDTRIRTFIYSPNEVYKLITEYGYQSNIELSKDEKILTISMGDTVAFKVTPAGNRIFVRALQNDSITNMTIVTDRNTYQFELSSFVEEDHDIIYVMRFYYPEGDVDKKNNDIMIKEFTSSQIPNDSLNYNYHVTGETLLHPEEIFDNGLKTFIQLPESFKHMPNLYRVTESRVEEKLIYSKEGEYIVVSGVFDNMAVRYDNDVICIKNRKILR